MSQIIIWPLRKTWLSTWWQNPCGNHRGQMFLVVGHQVCTHLRRDFVPLLFADPLQVIKVSRLTFGNLNLQLPPQIFYLIKVWRLARPLQDLNVLLLEPLLCCLGRVLWVIVMMEYPSRPIFNALAGFNALALTVQFWSHLTTTLSPSHSDVQRQNSDGPVHVLSWAEGPCGCCRISVLHGVVCYQLFSWWLWSHLRIIAPTVVTFSPSCLAMVL